MWRETDTKTYGFNRPTFGDKPSGAVLAAALDLTAETCSQIDEDAASKIKNDSFVDDIVTGDDRRRHWRRTYRLEEVPKTMVGWKMTEW